MPVDKNAKGGVDTKPRVTHETHEVIATLALTQEYAPQILQEPSTENGGVMRVRVPFYVGESVNVPPKFSKKVYFPTKTLPSLVQEGNRQVDEGLQPLTVYGRHNHAMDGNHLPIGRVAGLEQEGRIGYATLEIASTTDGRDAQKLIQERMVNAVSLRAVRRVNLGRGKFQGEDVYVFQEGSALDGIDLAPNSPAQPTYGIEVLNEEARVEPVSTKSTRRRKLSEEITLEDVPGDVKEAIERPIRAQVEKITQERDALVAEKKLRERDDYLREIASKTREPEAGFKVMQDLCDEKKALDRASASTAVTPFLLQALEQATSSKKEPEKTKEQLIQELFTTRTPSGSAVSQEPPVDKPQDQPFISQEEAAYLSTSGGLLAPEF